MLIDYIYLIIILALVGVVIFLIYLSYEYRVFNQFASPLIESFTSLDIPNTFNSLNANYQTNINDFINQYTNTGINAYNQQIISDNALFNSLLNQYQTNYNNSNALLQLKNKIAPIPTTFPINQVIKTIKSNYMHNI